jgi:hypothetical protein
VNRLGAVTAVTVTLLVCAVATDIAGTDSAREWERAAMVWVIVWGLAVLAARRGRS